MHRHPLPHADEPEPAGARRARGPAPVVLDGDDQVRAVLDERDRGDGVGPGVLADVGQRLLHDAEHRERDAVRDGRDGVGQGGPDAAGLDVRVEQTRKVGQARLRHELGVGRPAQQTEQPTHLRQRLAPRRGDGLERADGDGGVLLGGVPGAVGLDDHAGDAVRDDVVHLAGHAGAFLRGRRLRASLGLGGHPLAPLHQGCLVRAADARLRAERPRRDDDRTHAEQVRQERGEGELGLHHPGGWHVVARRRHPHPGGDAGGDEAERQPHPRVPRPTEPGQGVESNRVGELADRRVLVRQRLHAAERPDGREGGGRVPTPPHQHCDLCTAEQRHDRRLPEHERPRGDEQEAGDQRGVQPLLSRRSEPPGAPSGRLDVDPAHPPDPRRTPPPARPPQV